ncbi:hypothetical protein LEP1GSC120_3545 [Leptospira santarosai str. 200702252]|nr:hypothetical protein LEP1GSC130_2774 [Leptospira santarosai str. 200403458]EMO98247.1 hypothetical protein LEP1GSC120_3545 [Leptospira santarosai str. 200702252]
MRNSKWKLSSLTIFTLFIFHLNCGKISSPDPKARKKEITQKITPLLLGILSTLIVSTLQIGPRTIKSNQLI